jgi:hypothetical protein
MLGSAQLRERLRSCSALRDETSFPAGAERITMGTVKAIVGFLVVVGAIYGGFQIIPPELNNYSFQDDIRNVAMVGGGNPHLTDQDLTDAVMKKAQERQIPLAPEHVTVQRIGTPGALAVYVAADYSVPVNLPGYSFALHFTPSSGNKGY